MKMIQERVLKNMKKVVYILTAFLTLSLTSCGGSEQSTDGQGAGTQADQGINPGQGPHTGAGHSASGGTDTLGNNAPSAPVESNPGTDANNRAQRGDTVTTFQGAGSDSAAAGKANKRQQDLNKKDQSPQKTSN